MKLNLLSPCFLTFILTISRPAFANPEVDKTRALSPSATESLMTFRAAVILPDDQKPTDKNINKIIHFQVSHLLSQFDSSVYARSLGARNTKGNGVLALGRIEKLKIISISKVWNGHEITYDAEVELLMADSLIRPAETKEIKFYLPRDPTNNYVIEATDKDYPQKEYYHYFWKPWEKSKQHLFKDMNAVDQITATVTADTLSNPNLAPDFKKLKETIIKQGELRIAFLLGFDGVTSKKQDLGRKSFNEFKKYFEKKGFTLVSSRKSQTAPVAEYIKEATMQTPKLRITLTLSSSDYPRPKVFARRLRDAFENADIISYLGHSGLEGNLYIDNIIRQSSPDPKHPIPIKFKNSYQILYFDSCCSYSLYADMYGLAKKGGHNIDVITNGTSSLFSTQNIEQLAFIEPFIKFEVNQKWLDILRRIEKSQKCGSYLLNVTSLKQ